MSHGLAGLMLHSVQDSPTFPDKWVRAAQLHLGAARAAALQLWLAADEVPDYALYTATWALIAPQLADLFPGAHWQNATCACGLLRGAKNRLMHGHAHAEELHG